VNTLNTMVSKENHNPIPQRYHSDTTRHISNLMPLFSTRTIRRSRNRSSMTVCRVMLLLVVLVVLLQQQPDSILAFSPSLPHYSTTTTTPSRLQPILLQHSLVASMSKNSKEQEPEEDSEAIIVAALTRRTVFSRVACATFTAALTMTELAQQPASATYSAYTRREQDWQERQKSSNIQYKTAKDLRRELRSIAPMNSERSRIFCPNGPSSAVSPLMENKCSDVVFATPSVYGRSNDVLGNSVPGFTDGRSSERYAAAAAVMGGFPSYVKSTK
jgi:hypothetical protein